MPTTLKFYFNCSASFFPSKCVSSSIDYSLPCIRGLECATTHIKINYRDRSSWTLLSQLNLLPLRDVFCLKCCSRVELKSWNFNFKRILRTINNYWVIDASNVRTINSHTRMWYLNFSLSCFYRHQHHLDH